MLSHAHVAGIGSQSIHINGDIRINSIYIFFGQRKDQLHVYSFPLLDFDQMLRGQYLQGSVYIYIKLIDTQDIIRVCKFKETIAM